MAALPPAWTSTLLAFAIPVPLFLQLWFFFGLMGFFSALPSSFPSEFLRQSRPIMEH